MNSLETLDEEGYIVKMENVNKNVLTPKGEEMHISEWAGIMKCYEVFIRSDAFSLIEIAKKIK